MSCPGCIVCEEAHHWLAFVDDDGMPGFICRHCPETQTIDVHYQPELEELGLCLTDPEVRLVVLDDSGERVVDERWRSCIWCRAAIADTREGSTCGRIRCEAREAIWLAEHPNSAPREQNDIVDERYF